MSVCLNGLPSFITVITVLRVLLFTKRSSSLSCNLRCYQRSCSMLAVWSLKVAAYSLSSSSRSSEPMNSVVVARNLGRQQSISRATDTVPTYVPVVLAEYTTSACPKRAERLKALAWYHPTGVAGSPELATSVRDSSRSNLQCLCRYIFSTKMLAAQALLCTIPMDRKH
jgi:hypothetical protein